MKKCLFLILILLITSQTLLGYREIDEDEFRLYQWLPAIVNNSMFSLALESNDNNQFTRNFIQRAHENLKNNRLGFTTYCLAYVVEGNQTQRNIWRYFIVSKNNFTNTCMAILSTINDPSVRAHVALYGCLGALRQALQRATISSSGSATHPS